MDVEEEDEVDDEKEFDVEDGKVDKWEEGGRGNINVYYNFKLQEQKIKQNVATSAE